MGNYSTIASSTRPGLLILLIDKSKESIDFTNRIINSFIGKLFDGTRVRDCFYFCVIDQEGSVLLYNSLNELDEHPLRIITSIKKVPDGEGGFADVHVHKPIWVEEGLASINLGNALNVVNRIIEEWNSNTAYGPTPVVLCAVSDVSSFYSERNINIVKRIKRQRCRDGAALFFYVDFAPVKGRLAQANPLGYDIFSAVPQTWLDWFDHDSYFREIRNLSSDGLSADYCIALLIEILVPHS